jgi:hypothetical protein
MTAVGQPRRGWGKFLVEMLCIGILAVAVGKDVSEASTKCDTAYDCSSDCARTSETYIEVISVTNRFTTGTKTLKCGLIIASPNPDCRGASAVQDASCPGTCCK